MNKRARKCQHCRRAFEPRRIDQKYCSHKCRQATYRQRQAKQKAAQKRLPREWGTPAILATCEHCGGSFWAKSERARFCSTSCRTMYHRALKAALPLALHQWAGVAEEAAGDLVESQPVSQVRQLLERAGFEYIHQARRWLATGDKAEEAFSNLGDG